MKDEIVNQNREEDKERDRQAVKEEKCEEEEEKLTEEFEAQASVFLPSFYLQL